MNKRIFIHAAILAVVVSSIAALPSVAASRAAVSVTVFDNSAADWGGGDWMVYEPWVSGPVGRQCFQGKVANIFQNFTPQYGVCPDEDFLVRYKGTLKAPATGSYKFYVRSDDGFYMTLGSRVIISDWEDQAPGEWNSESQPIRLLRGRPQTLVAWYYENGGGNEVGLYYSLNGGTIRPVPASWFAIR